MIIMEIHKISNVFVRLVFVLSALFLVQTEAMSESKEKQLAFPGAEGFGRYVTGGRGGTVYHVTTLEDTGTKGSFRYACNQKGKRTIVFDVSGTIYLKSELKLKNGDLTIAGQTAPGQGICIADYPFVIACKNLIIRYVHFRLGNRNVAKHEGDGLGGYDSENIMIDHCSVSWSIDECLSVYGSKNTTVQWCIVSHSLMDAGHSKGSHGYGGNWGGSGASYHHNLMAHHNSRTPRLGPRPGTQKDERMDMRNNVFYNWAGNGCYGGEGMNVNIVNNYYKPGPATFTRNAGYQKRIAGIGIRTSDYTNHFGTPNNWDVMWHVWGDYYVTGNVNPSHADVTKDNWTYGIYNQIDNSKVDNTFTKTTRDTIKIDEPIPFVEVTTHTAEKAFEKVLENAGCIKNVNGTWMRDSYDETIVNDTRNGVTKYTGTGFGLINNQDEAGGWPELTSLTAPTDTDGDGMPDDWESQNGLNPNSATDGKTVQADGYTNLEHYLNSLVAEITTRQTLEGELMGHRVNTDGSITAINDVLISDHTGISAYNNKNVYSLNGIVIKMNAKESDLSRLPRGIYIHKGKKVVIK